MSFYLWVQQGDKVQKTKKNKSNLIVFSVTIWLKFLFLPQHLDKCSAFLVSPSSRISLLGQRTNSCKQLLPFQVIYQTLGQQSWYWAYVITPPRHPRGCLCASRTTKVVTVTHNWKPGLCRLECASCHVAFCWLSTIWRAQWHDQFAKAVEQGIILALISHKAMPSLYETDRWKKKKNEIQENVREGVWRLTGR